MILWLNANSSCMVNCRTVCLLLMNYTEITTIKISGSLSFKRLLWRLMAFLTHVRGHSLGGAISFIWFLIFYVEQGLLCLPENLKPPPIFWYCPTVLFTLLVCLFVEFYVLTISCVRSCCTRACICQTKIPER